MAGDGQFVAAYDAAQRLHCINAETNHVIALDPVAGTPTALCWHPRESLLAVSLLGTKIICHSHVHTCHLRLLLAIVAVCDCLQATQLPCFLLTASLAIVSGKPRPRLFRWRRLVLGSCFIHRGPTCCSCGALNGLHPTILTLCPRPIISLSSKSSAGVPLAQRPAATCPFVQNIAPLFS